MKLNNSLGRQDPILPGILLLFSLVLIYFAYLPGLTAALHFDAEHNLRALQSVSDLDSALRYIFTGVAGPLGRPLALASFIVDSAAWPHQISQLIHTNILIHLINGALVAWVSLLIVRMHSGDEKKANWVALIAASVWLSSPLLASTSFLVIQRMTSLAGLFMLAGLVSHLSIRNAMEARPRVALLLLSVSLAFFTACAALSKENGLLLPVLILVVECFLLSPPKNLKAVHWRSWAFLFLVVPLVAIAGYLATRWGYSESVLLRRDFTAGERLLTQAVVLWEYLFNAALPSIHRVGPFHDNYPVVRSVVAPGAIVAVIAWLGAMVSGILLRKRLPMVGFAIFWFLGAHMVESTVVPLELYFEHRNYIPLVGVFLAVSYGCYALAKRVSKIVYVGILCYVLLSIFVLFRVSSIWGDREYAADYWLEHNSGSLRASMHLAEILVARGDINAALMHMDIFRYENADYYPYVTLVSAYVRCAVGAAEMNTAELDDVAEEMSSAAFFPSLPGQLLKMTRERIDSACDQYSLATLFRVAESALENPAYFENKEARHTLYTVMGHLSGQNDPRGSLHYYEEALRARHNPGLLGDLVSSYIQLSEFERGCRFLQEMRRFEPGNVYLRSVWSEGIDSYEESISESFRQDC